MKRHMAKYVNGDGAVSALCFKKPRAINMMRETWTNQAEAVTCPQCIRVLTPSPPAAREEKP